MTDVFGYAKGTAQLGVMIVASRNGEAVNPHYDACKLLYGEQRGVRLWKRKLVMKYVL
jgi:hypothetical protein